GRRGMRISGPGGPLDGWRSALGGRRAAVRRGGGGGVGGVESGRAARGHVEEAHALNLLSGLSPIKQGEASLTCRNVVRVASPNRSSQAPPNRSPSAPPNRSPPAPPTGSPASPLLLAAPPPYPRRMTPRHLAGHRLVAQGLGERLFRRPGLREECAALEKEAMKELLLPGFDELVLGYRDRLYLMDEARHDAIT